MNESKPEDIPAGGSRPPPVAPSPPIRYDLGAMLKENPQLCRVLEIIRVNPEYLRLELVARAVFDFGSFSLGAFIYCAAAPPYRTEAQRADIFVGMTATNQTKLRRSGINDDASPLGLKFIFISGSTNMPRLTARGNDLARLRSQPGISSSPLHRMEMGDQNVTLTTLERLKTAQTQRG